MNSLTARGFVISNGFKASGGRIWRLARARSLIGGSISPFGELLLNIHALVLQTFAHRRVDQPIRGPVPLAEDSGGNNEIGSTETEAEIIHARSLMLSAPEAGLIAKLDLLELEGNRATPVDYKRGRMPDLPEGAWEPERVQLCAQGLILRENGYECESGVLYFVESKRRVEIPCDALLVQRTQTLIRQLRELGAGGTIPPPLKDSPKYLRCSLVVIYLPDETNLLTHSEMQAPSAPGNGSEAKTGKTKTAAAHAGRCFAALSAIAGNRAGQNRRAAVHHRTRGQKVAPHREAKRHLAGVSLRE